MDHHWETTDMTGVLPPIIIARRDHARLERLAANAMRERHPVSRFLISEIQRAVVCDANKMPPGVAGLNGWVTYRVDGSRQTESKILVCPDEFRSAQLNLSVLSPLGAAVLGMRAGDCMKFFSIGGGLHVVLVESVVAPVGAPVLFPLKARREASQATTGPRGPDDEGPKAA
jgi:regulator of nucleoside diphosphate kinase